jgi:hypothetical protein
VPALGLDLPPTAIGKDFLPGGALVGRSPGGSGVQVSLFGLAGLLAGWEEGVEVNLLGLSLGVDVKEPALRLPVVGRVGHPGLAVNGVPRAAGGGPPGSRHARPTGDAAGTAEAGPRLDAVSMPGLHSAP